MENNELHDYDEMDSDHLIIDEDDAGVQKKNNENKNDEVPPYPLYKMYNRFQIKPGDVVIDFEG
jgi:hypothetical protein